MNILINFSELKTGGGQNVALNFVSSIISNSELLDDELFYIVVKGSQLDKKLTSSVSRNRLIRTYSNPMARIFHEMICSPLYLKKNKIDIIYSYFGWGIFPRKYPQVSGSAASNLYFPEIDFWKQYKGLSKLKKILIDKYRICGLKRSKGIIFETSFLEFRFHEIFRFRALTTTIKPSISIIKNAVSALRLNLNTKSGLFLCGWQLNKNILIIPEIANELKKRAIPFTFIITASKDNSSECRLFLEKVKRFKVEHYIQIIGSVDKTQLSSLYNQIDLVFLLSKLESFSNNIIEAWSFRRPLVVADELWSRNICGDAAIYVDRDSVLDISNIIELYFKGEKFNNIVENGTKMLNTYPTIDERTKAELSFLKYVYETDV